jgi:hypothetical protein
MIGVTIIRAILGVFGGLLFAGGLALAFASNGADSFFAAAFMLIGGAVLLLVAVLEVSRYRSEAVDAARLPSPPAGGEPTLPEARFRRTDEVFVDPTSRLRMRVYSDPRTGERRYVVDGSSTR